MGERFGGRQKGTPNKTTRKFKDALTAVYEDIGGNAALADWARENRGDFYRLCSKLIPIESGQTGNAFAGGVTIVIGQVENKKSEWAERVIEPLPAQVDAIAVKVDDEEDD